MKYKVFSAGIPHLNHVCSIQDMFSRHNTARFVVYMLCVCMCVCLKKNQSAPRPSEHPPVMGGKMSKHLGGIKGCNYKTSSWHLNRFPDADNIGSTV